MKKTIPEAVLVGGVVVVTAFLHIFLRANLISLIPLPLALSVWVIWTLPAPGYYLLILAVVSELLSWLPPGLMTLTILLPLAIKRLRQDTDVDLSFTFAATIATTVILQNIVMSSPLFFSLISSDNTVGVLSRLPWLIWLFSSIATTLTIMLLCFGTQVILPRYKHHDTARVHHRF